MHIVEQKAMKLPVFLVIWLFSYIALQIKISIILYITLKTKHCVVVTLEEDFSIVYFVQVKHALLELYMNRKLDIFKQYI
jgi:hypothetical protein